MIETGDELPRLVVRPPGPASRAWADRLARVEARSVTWRRDDFPVFWSAARGSNVEDADGNVYVDMTAAFGVAVAGHGHPTVTAAIREAAGRLVHGMGDVHPPIAKVALLERLSALSPWLETRGIFASSGSEAVEIALKTAQLATDRPGILAFEGGYHGLTFGALSVTSRNDFRRPFQSRLFGPTEFVPFPTMSESPGACLEALDRAFDSAEARGTPIGAVIVEPLQGRGGVRVPPPGFLEGLVARTRKAGALAVFDEIFTGTRANRRSPGASTRGSGTGSPLSRKSTRRGPPVERLPRSSGTSWTHGPSPPVRRSTLRRSWATRSRVRRGWLCSTFWRKRSCPRGPGRRERGSRVSLGEALAGVDSVAELRGRGLCVGIKLAGGVGSAAGTRRPPPPGGIHHASCGA